MLNKFKSFLNTNKKIFILSLCLLIATGFCACFIKNKQPAVQPVASVNNVISSNNEEEFLTLDYVKPADSLKVSPISTTGGSWGEDNKPDSVIGGSTITFTYANKAVTVVYKDKNQVSKTKTYQAQNGYKLTRLSINEVHGESVTERYYIEVSETGIILFNKDGVQQSGLTLTPEDIVKGYQEEDNTIRISATTEKIVYKTDILYYAQEIHNQPNYPCDNYALETTYTIEDTITFPGSEFINEDFQSSNFSTLSSNDRDLIESYLEGDVETTKDNKRFGAWAMRDPLAYRSNGFAVYFGEDANNNIYLRFANAGFNHATLQYEFYFQISKIVLGNGVSGMFDDINFTNSTGELNGVTYYLYGLDNVSYVEISALCKGSWGNFPDIFGESYNAINARWANTYELEINTNDTWNGQTDKNGKPLASVVVNDTISNTTTEGNKGVITIYNSEESAYGFMSSVGIAEGVGEYGYSFRKDFTNKQWMEVSNGSYYYLYNYGYEIDGYLIYMQTSKGSRVGVSYYQGRWTWGRFGTTDIDDLKDQNIANLSVIATKIDEYMYANGDKLSGVVYMTPIWKSANVKIQDAKGNELALTVFDNTESAADYSISSGTDNGQTIAFYTTSKNAGGVETDGNTGNIIASSAKFNYKNLTDLQVGYDNVNRTYNLKVEPYYADDVYLVQLTGINPTTSEIIDGDVYYRYQIASSHAYERLVRDDKNRLSYGYYDLANLPTNDDPYKFVGYTDYVELCEDHYVDTYIDFLKLNIKQYIDGIGYINKEWNEDLGYYVDITPTERSVVKGNFKFLNNIMFEGSAAFINSKEIIDSTDSPLLYVLVPNNNVVNLPEFVQKNYNIVAYEHGDPNIYYTTQSFNSSEHESFVADCDEYTDNLWTYENNVTAKGVFDNTLTPITARKRYELNIQTLMDGNLGRYGYAKIDINDTTDNTDKGVNDASYVAIFHDGAMKYYKYALNSLPNNLNGFIFNGGLEIIEFYAGSDVKITVYDQAGDVAAVANDDNFLSMVGYRYNNTTSNFDYINLNGYTSNINSATAIEDKLKASGYEFEVKVNYVPIAYNIDFAIDNKASGDFNLTYDGVSTPKSYAVKITNAIVGNKYSMVYNASTGYDFNTNAFTFGLYDIVLQTSRNTVNQTYLLNLNSQWLRDYYYKYYNTAYLYVDILPTELGTVTINTEIYTFKVGVKYYDTTQSGIFATEEKSVTDNKVTYETGEFENFIWTGKVLVVENGMYVAKVNEEKYAVLNARLFFPNNYTTITYNNYEIYNFLLTQKPNESVDIENATLAYMVNNSSGRIVPYENRELFIMLEVRKLHSIYVQVKQYNANIAEPNQNMVTKVKNTPANSVDVKGGAGTTANLYTYNGLENTITASNLDLKRYQGVEYSIDGVTYTANEAGYNLPFTTSKDHIITIKYIPKALKANVQVVVDGVKIEDEDDYAEYVTIDVQPNAKSEYYCNNKVAFAYTVNSPIHLGRVVVNGYADYSTSTIEHIVADKDFDSQAINIVLYLEELDSSSVNIYYNLAYNSQRTSNEDYGTIAVLSNGVNVGSNGIYVGSKLQFKLNMNDGYKYVGYQHNDSNLIEKELDAGSNILTITDNFNPDVDFGRYIVYVEKVNVDVKLNVGSFNNIYTITSQDTAYRTLTSSSDPVATINDIIVGKTINLVAQEDFDREILDYFYLVKKDGNRVYLTDDGTVTGNPLPTLTLTEELLSRSVKNADGTYVVTLGVVGTPKYNIKYSIIGEELMTTDSSITVDGIACLSDSYYIKDSVVHFNIHAKALNSVTGTDKDTTNYYMYIKVNGVLVSTDSMPNYIADILLNEDKLVEIQIRPLEYNVNITENIYTNITDLKNQTPTKVVENPVNGFTINQGGKDYSKDAIITFNASAEDRTLKAIYIHGNGENGQNLVILVDNGTIKYGTFTIVGENENQQFVIELEDKTPADYGYDVEFNKHTNKVIISYTTFGDVNIRIDYVDFKTISPIN